MITDEQTAKMTVMVKTLESMAPDKRYVLLRQVAAEGGFTVSITLKNLKEDIDIRPVDAPTALEQAEAGRIEALKVAENVLALGKEQGQDWDRFWAAMGVLSSEITVDQAIEKYKALEADLAYVRSELTRVAEDRDDARKYAARAVQDSKDHDQAREEWSEKNKVLATLIVELEKDRDGWKAEYEMCVNAWARELGPIWRKTHLIDTLVVGTREMRSRLEAAEKVCELAKNCRPDLDQFRLAFLSAYEAWQKLSAV
jgi:hypothetical protein